MQTHHVCRGALAAIAGALLAAGCSNSSQIDPYNGVIDNSLGIPPGAATGTGALDVKFQPNGTSAALCINNISKASTCYIQQLGYANGKPIYFLNAGAVTTGNATGARLLPTLTLPDGRFGFSSALTSHQVNDGSGGWHADVFPHSCTPGTRPFDPQIDAYRNTQQFAVVDALPLSNAANTSALPVVPFVSVYGVTGVSGETCNDIKDHDSIADPPGAGSFGAVRSANPSGYEVWLVMDPSIAIVDNTGQAWACPTSVPPDPACPPGQLNPQYAGNPVFSFWYKGLLGNYASGGRIPTSSDGSLVAMEGVVIDPGSGFAKTTDSQAILLPYAPGDDGYSPIVRLHDYHLKGSEKLGTWQGICPTGATCPSNYLPFASAGAVFNTVFIVASAQ